MGCPSAPIPEASAIRASVFGSVQGVGFRDATRRRASELGLMGWVRNAEDGSVAVHAEGPPAAVETFLAYLRRGPRGARVEDVQAQSVRVEGHEQFAVRGISAGIFVVQQHAASTPHFDLRLQVASQLRSWTLPKGPSLDPAAKRLAVEVAPHALEQGACEGRGGGGAVLVWDRGHYEQGGRVPWPQALERGHAVFVLHGHKLEGGFALQRTRPGDKAQWLLVKRRDEYAQPGFDVVAEQPQSVLSGRTLEQLLADES